MPIRNREIGELRSVLRPFEPREVVVEASPSWPWLHDLLDGPDCRFVLAHPKRLRAIAESNYKNDAIDAKLLARMRVVDLIPEVCCKPSSNASKPPSLGTAHAWLASLPRPPHGSTPSFIPWA